MKASNVHTLKLEMPQVANALGMSVTQLESLHKNGKLGQFVQRDWFKPAVKFVHRDDLPALKAHLKNVEPVTKEVWLTLPEVAEKCGTKMSVINDMRCRTNTFPKVEEKRVRSKSGYGANIVVKASDLPTIMEAIKRRRTRAVSISKAMKKHHAEKRKANVATSYRPVQNVVSSYLAQLPTKDTQREAIALELLKAGFSDAAAYLVKSHG